MNQVNLPQKALRRPISEHYLDSEGKQQTRATDTDFETLHSRHVKVILNLPDFLKNKERIGWIGYACAYYDAGKYGKALQYLNWLLKSMPALEPPIFYYMRVCERVLTIPLTKKEVQYKAKLALYGALPKWLKWTMPGLKFCVRCKWCGRYTPYIQPDVPTFGFATSANSCISCGRMYPMPSWIWDSPDGRAYSYYRTSFSDEKFYEEFEQDYDPKPLCQYQRK